MPAETRAPNIILVNCDDLGYGDLGCYGSCYNRTPGLDRMAEEGVRFTDFYMAAAVCTPSRAAMMTGCYPRRVGMTRVLFPGSATGLNPAETSVAELLRARGYATKMVGKWHCGDQPEFLPTRFGFDGYYGIPYSNDMGRQVGDIRQRPPLPLLLDEDVLQQQPDQAALTERYLEESVRFIRENRDGPFFLYLAHMYVHVPIYAPASFLAASRNGRYGAGVECVDWGMRVLFHELERLGIDEQTLVVFTSDNGSRNRDEGGSNAPLRGRKGETWEGGLRVPCIARFPGRIPAGRVCSEIATAMDFLPTFARLAGAELPADRAIDGADITPLLCEPETASSPHDAFYYYGGESLHGVRSGRWKLRVRFAADAAGNVAPDGHELFDLVDDVGETTDRSAQRPDVVAELEKRMEAMRADLGDAQTERPPTNARPAGEVADPRPLTHDETAHPHICAEYDLPDRG